jgi:hypothetical protein
MWVGVIAGKLGAITEKGFILDQPSIQVFETVGSLIFEGMLE